MLSVLPHAMHSAQPTDPVAELLQSGERARANVTISREVETSHPVFVFRVSGTRLAVPTQHVISVSDASPPARIPLTPNHILGLVAHGERVLPILDLHRFFGLPQEAKGATSDIDARNRFVIVRANGMEVGILATRVDGPREPADATVKAPKSLGDEPLARFTTHEINLEDAVVYLLDLPAVLDAAKVRA